MDNRLVVNQPICPSIPQRIRKRKIFFKGQRLLCRNIKPLLCLSPVVRDPPQPEAEASVAKDIRRWRSSLHGSGSSQVRKNSQCEISSLSAFCTLIGLDVRRVLEMALFFSLVNKSAPGTVKENDTHLPAKRWRHFTEITEHPRVC